MRKLIAQAKTEMGDEWSDSKVLDIPTFEDMYERSEDEAQEADILGEGIAVGMDEVALIMHSSGERSPMDFHCEMADGGSGSTSFPKPIRITHRQYQQWSHVHCTLRSLCFLGLCSPGCDQGTMTSICAGYASAYMLCPCSVRPAVIIPLRGFQHRVWHADVVGIVVTTAAVSFPISTLRLSCIS